MTGSFLPHPVPAMLHGYPVMSAIRDHEHGDLWTVMCRRTEEGVWIGRERFVTFRVWWSAINGKYETEAGNYGEAVGMTFTQAQRAMLDRAGVMPGRIDERGITDGAYETGWMLIDGQRINLWVDRPARDFCRVALCTEAGMGCGDGTLNRQGLTIELPEDWSAEAKVRATAVIAATVFQPETTTEHPVPDGGVTSRPSAAVEPDNGGRDDE